MNSKQVIEKLKEGWTLEGFYHFGGRWSYSLQKQGEKPITVTKSVVDSLERHKKIAIKTDNAYPPNMKIELEKDFFTAWSEIIQNLEFR